MLALLLEHGSLPRAELLNKTSPLFPELLTEQVEVLLDSLCARSLLWSDNGLVWFSPEGEKEFGRRNFMALTSVFVSPPQFLVLHGQAEVGYVSPIVLLPDKDQPASISLAGRAWRVASIDWKGKRAWVELTESARSTRWDGGSRGIGFELAQAVRRAVTEEPPPVALTQRAADALQGLRDRFGFLPAENCTVLSVEKDRLRWWTFAGLAANRALVAAFTRQGILAKSGDDFSLSLPLHLERRAFEHCLKELGPDEFPPVVPADALTGIKFAGSLPAGLQSEVAAARLVDSPRATEVAGRSVVFTGHGWGAFPK